MTDEHDDLSEHFEELADALAEFTETEEREMRDAERILVQTAEAFESQGAIREGTAELLSQHFGYE